LRQPRQQALHPTKNTQVGFPLPSFTLSLKPELGSNITKGKEKRRVGIRYTSTFDGRIAPDPKMLCGKLLKISAILE
jgi:hypothetical protein